MKDVFDLQLYLDYDAVSQNIRCRADRQEAKVFVVIGERGRPLRVLAYSEEDAEEELENLRDL